MEVKNIDLDNGIVQYPITKTKAFEMPISQFMIELLRKRIADNAEEFGQMSMGLPVSHVSERSS